ncbi:photosystem reaction center subunit H [Novosphingobium endophyticum]|uniref:Photosystem reaction center subunit H n=1 Tax=Novosphingobium endophyticum TaxID=1955250 RepID=A0A916TWV3_9SPHN|nr:PRC-barrel domain-containing protein [Novosphingobium endophyticum]GGC14570.1 photosystem reaction center subunit H [Novosphingobium endophyticum]
MERHDAEAFLVEAEVSELGVRSQDGDKLGHVKSFVVDKRTGRSVYAVLSLGGFLGLNKSFYPVPFNLLGYEATDDNYVITIDRRILEGGPSWSNNAPEFDQAYANRVSSYYGPATPA